MHSKQMLLELSLLTLTVLIGKVYCELIGFDTDITPEMETFQHSIKRMKLEENNETILFESQINRGGLITHQWTDGNDWLNQHSIIRIYVDYEFQPSIQYSLLLGHGIPYELCNDINTTNNRNMIDKFGTQYITHQSKHGGLANFYMIPFKKHIKISMTVFNQGYLSYTIRGMYNTPVIFSEFNYELPQNTRLYLYRTENVSLKRMEHVSLAKIENSGGALFGVTLMTQSSHNFLHLEACFRAKIDGTFHTLSSGTEDFFGSSMYYDTGPYAANQYGATWIDNQKFGTATYRFFTQDPILFHNQFELIWKNGDNQYCNEALGMVTLGSNVNDVKVTAYVWVYQFDNQNNDATPEFQGSYEMPQSNPQSCFHFSSVDTWMTVISVLPIVAFFGLQLSG